MRAVRFDRYGDASVLEVVDVETPQPGPGEVLVGMRAAGINPGEIAIREGHMHARFPASFPSGEGSDLAGVVQRLGDGVTQFRVGEEVIGFTNARASHAEQVIVEEQNMTTRPPEVPWEAAGALPIAGMTAYAAVRAVAPERDETLVVSAAAGGVGTIAVQLGARTGARVIGLASVDHHEWLREHRVIPIDYHGDLAASIHAVAAGGVDAFIDCFGNGYVELALELGAKPERIDTITDFAAAERHGVKTEGSAAGSSAAVLAELAQLIAAGELEVPIAGVYPLERVREAYEELARRHVLGKIVLVP